MRFVLIICLALLVGCEEDDIDLVYPNGKPWVPVEDRDVGILENDALRQNPYLRRMPKNDREWTRFMQTLNGQRVITGLVAYKSATTSRNTTTTYADDPDLAITLQSNAVYAIDFLLLPYNEASTPDMKIQFAFSGSGNFRRIVGVNNEPAATSFSFLGPLTSGVVFDQLPAYAPFDPGAIWGTVTYETTTAGTFTVQWAQSSSSGNDVRLTAGSYIKATRLTE